MNDGPKLLNQKDAARHLGVSVNTFVRYHRPHIPAKGGKRRMFPVALIDAYAASVDSAKASASSPDDLEFWLQKMREDDKS
jgi:hypothetical protein